MEPTYPLDRIRTLVGQEGAWLITLTAQQTALQIGCDEQDVVECIQETLHESHFYKTMPAEKRAGLWQDVYRLTFRGVRVYLKVQINAAGHAVIVSFKEDTG
jgi:motility quorum-sensing regulator / GCU-specific mRNA interferase toxin